MKFELRYFTGTGNSLKILKTIQSTFLSNNHIASLREINLLEKSLNADVIGFCFPVYAFGLPRIARRYLKGLDKFPEGQKAFIVITAGELTESGLSVNESVKILKKKNCDIIYSGVVHMPGNWTVAMDPPPKDEIPAILAKGNESAISIANDILNGTIKHHQFNYPNTYTKFGFYKEYYLFKYAGLQNLWKTFKIDENCNACEICFKVCPTNSIEFKEGKPTWKSSCEQCMRCVNYCPHKAIYQTYYKGAKERDRYFEPSFKPLKNYK